MSAGSQTGGDLVLALRDVEKGYDTVRVLEGASASFEPLRPHVVMGPSGAGKTTLLRLLAGLERPDAGTVVRGADVRLGMTFQEDRLCENLTATANIRLPHGYLPDELLERFLAQEREAMAACGLPIDARPVRELSGGQRRRVAILRCVLADANTLLFDEPLKGMDEKTVDAVMAFVGPLVAERTVLWATHDERDLAFFESPVLWRVEGGKLSTC
ncbi:MAG TPA: ATP-binding cassette domain-containing protein [Candidatus Olsenella excrementavium]|uniref:ATP-binding cassette domain-containing protein n=1 Tax=Candidatus Olsenella excrementavium TaxID=2838709 RepID=A0A9D2CIA0_9ACTN|nr:ATP-binding cassette domain-containing protein [Candidatus Olsenella excrementavium]